MVLKKEADLNNLEEKYIRWLSSLSKNDIPIAGGKGANLAEMYNAGFPVPPAFIITAQTFGKFLTEANLKEKIKKIISDTNVFNTKQLEENSKQIRELVIKAEIPEDMQKEITEAYSILCGNEEKEIFVAVRSSATAEDLADASFAGQQETFTNIKGKKFLIEAIKKCFASLYTARAVYYRKKKGFDKKETLL